MALRLHPRWFTFNLFKFKAFLPFGPDSYKAASQSQHTKTPAAGIRVSFPQALLLLTFYSLSVVLILRSGEHLVPLLLTQGEELSPCKLGTSPRLTKIEEKRKMLASVASKAQR